MKNLQKFKTSRMTHTHILKQFWGVLGSYCSPLHEKIMLLQIRWHYNMICFLTTFFKWWHIMIHIFHHFCSKEGRNFHIWVKNWFQQHFQPNILFQCGDCIQLKWDDHDTHLCPIKHFFKNASIILHSNSYCVTLREKWFEQHWRQQHHQATFPSFISNF